MRLARFCDLYLQKTLSIWNGFHWLSYGLPPINYNGPVRFAPVGKHCFCKNKHKNAPEISGTMLSRYHPGYCCLSLISDQSAISSLMRITVAPGRVVLHSEISFPPFQLSRLFQPSVRSESDPKKSILWGKEPPAYFISSSISFLKHVTSLYRYAMRVSMYPQDASSSSS